MRTRFCLLLGLASATVVLTTSATAGTAGSAGRARQAKLAAPVINESFTPLPCAGAPGHRTTLEMEGCAERRILRSDKQIDDLNQTIFGKLFDGAARRRFIAGHDAWLAYRRAYCLSVSDVFEGGTEAGVVDADCTASVNSQHVKDLKTFLVDLGGNQG
ncbi:MAG TPA: lysozyme inhibitor LprI family protein [Solirubrobacteraceae bacterium]|nr:lysozyme inhibitor LprI family protein [Solirubrobacteraceae bacterium]